MKYYINRKTNVLCIDENPYTSYLADRGYEEISKEEYVPNDEELIQPNQLDDDRITFLMEVTHDRKCKSNNRSKFILPKKAIYQTVDRYYAFNFWNFLFKNFIGFFGW